MRPSPPAIHYALSGLNVPLERIPRESDSFTLTAVPRTDLWRKPPGQDTSTAPIVFTTLRFPFVSAEVTVEAKWSLEWDQAGLVIFAGLPQTSNDTNNNHNNDNENTSHDSTLSIRQPPQYQAPSTLPAKWAKVGLEFSNNTCNASSAVANADGADWTISALPAHHAQRDDLRLKLERLGQSLWMSYQDDFGGWRKFREITGFFCGVEDKTVRVGVYASRPAGFHGAVPDDIERNLTVQFDNLLIF